MCNCIIKRTFTILLLLYYFIFVCAVAALFCTKPLNAKSTKRLSCLFSALNTVTTHFRNISGKPCVSCTGAGVCALWFVLSLMVSCVCAQDGDGQLRVGVAVGRGSGTGLSHCRSLRVGQAHECVSTKPFQRPQPSSTQVKAFIMDTSISHCTRHLQQNKRLQNQYCRCVRAGDY